MSRKHIRHQVFIHFKYYSCINMQIEKDIKNDFLDKH